MKKHVVPIVLVVLGLIRFGVIAKADSDIIINPDNGHSYQRFDETLSWHDAKSYCEEADGHLVTITSEKEDQFIYNNFYTPYYCWSGGTDENKEGKWTWITGESWEYKNWASGQPDNAGGKEHYLEIYFRTNNGFSWNDLAEEGRGEFICEWDESTGCDDCYTQADLDSAREEGRQACIKNPGSCGIVI